MQRMSSTLFKAVQKGLHLSKRLWSNRILANSPVLLVALSFSIAAAYGTAPQPTPGTSSTTHGRQQLTTKQAQPTSSVVEPSETTTTSGAYNQSDLGTNNTPQALTSEEISAPTNSNANQGTAGITAGTVTEPADTCSTTCPAPQYPAYPYYGCGSCQPHTPKSDAAYSCANMLCTD